VSVAARHQWPKLANAKLALLADTDLVVRSSYLSDRLIQMKPKLQNDSVLKKAIGGIPRVARTIVGLPPQERQKALDAVEYSYRETAVELGFGEGQARGWASVVMLSLQAEMQDCLRQ
jgi:DNA-directed RNA polymerase specialized sigma24 family protein